MMDAKIAYLIRQKLTTQAAYIAELGPYIELDYTNYQRRSGYNRVTERLIQIIIESAIDINEKLIEAVGEPPPPSAKESFDVVQRLGVLDDNLAVKFRRTYVGLRNRIVHDYERLDGSVVYHNARRLLKDAMSYIGSVRQFVDQNLVQDKAGESNG